MAINDRPAARGTRETLGGIERPTLFFFLGLFVMVSALEETGAIQEVADAIADATGATAPIAWSRECLMNPAYFSWPT